MSRRRSNRLALVLERKAAGCVDCGHVDLAHPEVFDFDHVRGDKTSGVASLATSGSVEDLIAEMDKCEVVCANCHRIRTKARPATTRGTSRK
jgi:hypothetical protein